MTPKGRFSVNVLFLLAPLAHIDAIAASGTSQAIFVLYRAFALIEGASREWRCGWREAYNARVGTGLLPRAVVGHRWQLQSFMRPISSIPFGLRKLFSAGKDGTFTGEHDIAAGK